MEITKERLVEMIDSVLGWGADHDEVFKGCLVDALGITEEEYEELFGESLDCYLGEDEEEDEEEEDEEINLPTEVTLKNFTIMNGEDMEETIHELLFEEYAYETKSFDYEITRAEVLDDGDKQICDAKITNITWEEE